MTRSNSDNEYYSLVSVLDYSLYYTLEAETDKHYTEDAKQIGNSNFTAFFDEVIQSDRYRADKA